MQIVYTELYYIPSGISHALYRVYVSYRTEDVPLAILTQTAGLPVVIVQ